MTRIAFDTIERSDRVRIDYGNIQSLAEDIFVNGLIHPLCISQDRQLVAGGRRSAALDYIRNNWQTLTNEGFTPHPDITDFIQTGQLVFGVTYTTKQIQDIGHLSELELIENVQRHNFSWQEEVIAIARIHNIRVRQKALEKSSWTQTQTGRLLGCSKANVSYCLSLSRHLEDKDSPIWKCSGVVEALQYLAKLAHDKASVMLAQQVKAKASTIPTIATPSSPNVELDQFIQKFDPTVFQPGAHIASPTDEFSPPSESTSAVPSPEETRSIIESNKDQIAEAMSVATKIVQNMDCLEFFKLIGKESVDHIVADPPYGIEMSNLDQSGQGQANIDRVADTHDVGENEKAFPKWLQGCYDILKPKGFCIWFCDQAQWQTLYDHAIRIGFKVQRWPFVWVKTTSCMNQQAAYNFTKATEIAMIMRKGDARLVSAQSTNYWVGGNTPEDRSAGVNHPFIKPKELWQHLLKAVALPGATVCDPFSGVGSSTRAMLLAGYMPVVCEIDPAHYAQQVNNVAKIYCELNGIKFS